MRLNTTKVFHDASSGIQESGGQGIAEWDFNLSIERAENGSKGTCLRDVLKARGHFTSDEAAIRLPPPPELLQLLTPRLLLLA
jgi:hypothetical protein